MILDTLKQLEQYMPKLIECHINRGVPGGYSSIMYSASDLFSAETGDPPPCFHCGPSLMGFIDKICGWWEANKYLLQEIPDPNAKDLGKFEQKRENGKFVKKNDAN